VFWEKRIWRVIDFREKINLPFTYPNEPFVQIIVDKIQDGELQAFSPLEDDFSLPMTKEQLWNKLAPIDTIRRPRLDGEGEEIVIIRTQPDWASFKKIKIKEDWIFDSKHSRMIVRILGIAPIRDVIHPETGMYLGEEELFWIYYPEARNFLVNYEAFNPHNDGIMSSWDDVFEMRYFSSYIVKETNPFDRSIENYAAGIDAILEGEKIANEIFEFEHELWEY
jgi:gliding motility associated protien GldN